MTMSPIIIYAREDEEGGRSGRGRGVRQKEKGGRGKDDEDANKRGINNDE